MDSKRYDLEPQLPRDCPRPGCPTLHPKCLPRGPGVLGSGNWIAQALGFFSHLCGRGHGLLDGN